MRTKFQRVLVGALESRVPAAKHEHQPLRGKLRLLRGTPAAPPRHAQGERGEASQALSAGPPAPSTHPPAPRRRSRKRDWGKCSPPRAATPRTSDERHGHRRAFHLWPAGCRGTHAPPPEVYAAWAAPPLSSRGLSKFTFSKSSKKFKPTNLTTRSAGRQLTLGFARRALDQYLSASVRMTNCGGLSSDWREPLAHRPTPNACNNPSQARDANSQCHLQSGASGQPRTLRLQSMPVR